MWSQDIRHAVRALAKAPAFTTIVVLTLGIGIGANTAIFSVVDGVLLRPAPFRDIERLVMVWETDRNSGTTREPASVPDALDFRAGSSQLDTMAAFMGAELNFAPERGEPARLAALAVTHDFLPLLGVEPILGRGFTPEEDRPNGPKVALIGESLWARAFERDPGVINRTIRLDEQTVTIVGVVSASADFGVLQILSSAAYARAFADRDARADVELWVPLQADPERFPRATHPIFVLGRLAATASVASAQAELESIASALERAYPENDGRGVFVERLTAVVLEPVRPALILLLGAVALVLIVACANVANLLLTRGAGRRREVAMRLALGAGTGRLVRQFLSESLVVTALAAGLGVLLAGLGLRLLLAIAPADIPRLSEVGIDWRVLAATLTLSTLVGLAFGLVPVVQSRGLDPQHVLKGEGGAQASSSRARRRLQSGLVVGELALAVMLVIGAGLLLRSFWHVQNLDPGFQPEGVLKAEYQLPETRYPTDFSRWPDWSEQHAFTRALLDRVATLPGVTAAAVAGNHPLDPGFTNSFVVVGREAEARSWPEISVRRVTPGYFRTVGLPLVRGRLLDDRDGTLAAPVAVVNEAAARRFFGDRDPLGQQLSFWGANRTIVGIAGNERFHGVAEPAPVAVYLPLAQAPSTTGAASVLVRTDGDPTALTGGLRRAVRDIDAGLAVFGVEPLRETLSRSLSQRRFTMLLLGAFAGVALLLAAVGVHGVLSYGVTQRAKEIGIRTALGAQPADVVGLIVRQGLVLAALGAALGLVGAWMLSRLLASMLFGVAPTDLPTFVAVPGILALVALVAGYLPVRRALSLDPVTTLRME